MVEQNPRVNSEDKTLAPCFVSLLDHSDALRMLSVRTHQCPVHIQYRAATPLRGMLVKLLHIPLVLVWVTCKFHPTAFE